MAVSRRAFLTGAAGAASAAVVPSLLGGRPAGQGASDVAARWLPMPRVAWAAGRTRAMPAPSHAFHVVSRATFGPTPEEVSRVEAMGADAWVDEQLRLGRLDDGAVESALSTLASLAWSMQEIKQSGGTRPVPNELVAATLYRQLHSRRQLYETLVDHWSNHFNLYHAEELIARVKTVDDREVVRRHALGSFRDMLHGSAKSLAMMRYLNTLQNTQAGPNENYGREVMELHTLGAGGPYTELDVKAVARCFTGWNRNNDTWAFEFRSADHDNGPKTVLGRRIAGTGVDEGDEVLDLLVDQPACPAHVARRLVRRYVADQPSESLVGVVAGAFGSDGDIPSMVRALFSSPQFAAATASPSGGPAKVRRPLELWCATLRVLRVRGDWLLNVPRDFYEGDRPEGSVYEGRLERYLEIMDQLPFRWRSPDGYPDTLARWGSTNVHLTRWNLALALVEGEVDGIEVDLLGRMSGAGVGNDANEILEFWRTEVLQRPILPEDRAILLAFLDPSGTGRLTGEEIAERTGLLVALMLASPYFLWR